MNRSRYSNWVWTQFFIASVIIILGPLCRSESGYVLRFAFAFILILIGAVAGLAGKKALGKNRRPSPEPRTDSSLVTTGIYSIIRHPMYLSLIALGIGWSFIWMSMAALVASIVFAVFLDRKARLEEELLCERFPVEYKEYMKKTWRFIPGIY